MSLDGSGPVEQVFDFPTLSLGFQNTADQRSIGAGGYYDINNLMPGQGGLRRRPSLAPLTAFTAGISYAGFQPSNVLNERYVNLFQYPTNVGLSAYLLATTRALYYRNTSGTWTDVTPVTTGTCNITNGTKALAGIGTVWLNTEAVTTNMLVLLSGTWYTIASVNSDTSITLTNNYTGPTLAGGAFSIKRCWNLNLSARVNNRIYAVALNSDIYICGQIGSDLNAAIAGIPIPAGAVLKLAGGAGYNVTPGTATVIASGVKAAGPGTPAALGYTWVPFGFDLLEDGRLIIAATWIQSATVQGAARLIYSSHLNVAVWTTTPAGFTDIQKTGMVSSMCRLGRSRAIHFDTGIVVADPTGQADPPLQFADSRARVGALGPWATIDVPDMGGQVYVGDDLNLRVFDGNADRVLDPNFQRLLVSKDGLSFASNLPLVGTLTDPRGVLRAGQATYLPHRQQYLFLYTVDYGNPPATFGNRSIIAVYDAAHGISYYWTVGAEVTMIATGWTGISGGYGSPVFGTTMEFVWGGPTINDQAGSNASNVFGVANPTTYTDTIAATFGAGLLDGNSGGCFFVTDALDMGAPGVIKAITRVEIVGEVMPGQTASQVLSAEVLSPLTAAISGVSLNEQSPAAFQSGSRALMFTFNAVGAFDAYRIRILARDIDAARVQATMNFKLLKLRVWWVPVGDQRAGIP